MGIPSPAQYAEGELTTPSQTAPVGWVGEGAIFPNYRGASKRQTASQEPGGKQDQDTGDLFLILHP